ncbi:hypothetical protein JTE90_012438 [Oedothorax gibbosus]|uniref:Uncharacterized protein n=1 Tax=Oedothorax gibbosus TaxID=931172 RepID=A0AAV6TFK1_9ARAC|nr:hypothetical protein JTE90_012438 [Oedothorax gibbosus]
MTHVKRGTWNPSPASVLKVPLEYLQTTPKICTGGGPRGLTPALKKHAPAKPPYHCGVNLHEGSSASGPGIGQRGRIHFGLVVRSVSFYTSLANSLPMATSDCLEKPNTFRARAFAWTP